MGHNVPADVPLVGDGKAIMGQFLQALDDRTPTSTTPRRRSGPASPPRSPRTRPRSPRRRRPTTAPINYYRAFRDLKDLLRPDDIIVGEGANTMDIGRTQMANVNPRHRLDAGTYGTMGIGLGFAVAAAVTNPGPAGRVRAGRLGVRLLAAWSCETICRYQLPITIVVMNNNGIGGGLAELPRGPADPAEHAACRAPATRS